MTDSTTEAAPAEPPRALPPGVAPPERIDLDDGYALRRPTLDDAQDIHDAIKSSFAEIHPWMPWCTDPVKIEDQRAWIESTFGNWSSGVAFNYSIVGPEDRALGTISLMDRVGIGGVEIGYWLRTDATGRGLVSRATAKLTEIGLGLPGIERVEIHCDATNARSAGVPRRLGFRLDREGPKEPVAPGETGLEQYWITP